MTFNIIKPDDFDFSYSDEKEFIEKKPKITSYDRKIIHIANVIKHLNECIILHDCQILIVKSIFINGKYVVFVECGRKFGKTEVMNYFLARIAATISNAALYYIAPFLKQAGEILWQPRRIQGFFTKRMINEFDIVFRNSDYRVIFRKTGSFIKLDGADNHQAYRGVNPHGLGYEEFKDHHPLFHDGMEPNLATFNAPLLIIGTPPESEDNDFCRMADFAMEDKDEDWFNFPTWANPHISKQWLLKVKKKLFKMGKQDEWFREYCAKRVKSKLRHIFGGFNTKKHVIKYNTIYQIIDRYRRDFEFYVTCDPASSSVFAILFSAYHKYKKIMYHLDEIYEKEPRQMATNPMIEKMVAKIKEIHPFFDEWTYTYDEAAKWFENEVINNFGEKYPDISFTPTEKHLSKKDYGIGLINQQINDNKFFMTDRCVNFKFEVNNYIKDKDGKIPKENDHLIDDARYTNHAANYTTPEENPVEDIEIDERKRGFRFEDDEIEDQRNERWDEILNESLGGWF